VVHRGVTPQDGWGVSKRAKGRAFDTSLLPALTHGYITVT
jgi:hypothetical protein